MLPIMPLMALGGAAAFTPLGQWMQKPGALLRGALTGNFGDEMSGSEMLASWAGVPQSDPAQLVGLYGGDQTPALFGNAGMQNTQLAPPTNREQFMAKPWVQGLGLAADLLIDPLTLLGGGAGALAGNRVSGKLGQIGQKALLADQVNDLGRLEDAANFGKTLTGQSGDDMVAMSMRGMAGSKPYQAAEAAQMMPYQPAIMDELGPMFNKSGQYIPPTTYNRVDDSARDMMMRTGLGIPGPGGSVATTLPKGMNAPTYLRGRGGKMFLEDPSWSALQPDDLLDKGGLYDVPTNLSGMGVPPPRYDYRDAMGGMPDMMGMPLGEAGDLATDMIGQRIAMSEGIPQIDNPLLKALYGMGFR